MKLRNVLIKSVSVSALVFLSSSTLFAVDKIQTIEEFNNSLPYWGTSWSYGGDEVKGVDGTRYFPGFYTGFVARSQYPNRIHVRTSRGNQTRITVILDDQTLNNYLFDLAKRYEVYKKFTSADGQKPLVRVLKQEAGTPQLEYFNAILESPKYSILDFVNDAKSGKESEAAIYTKSLDVLDQLNPARIFRLSFNLNSEFAKWKDDVKELVGNDDPASVFTASSQSTVIAINSLLWGRINITEKPSAETINQLVDAARLALSNSNEEAFMSSAIKLFKMATGSKYDFKTVNEKGEFQAALQCSDLKRCTLSYPEFTTVNPTGSAEATTRDDFGNKINDFRTPGLWQFFAYESSGRDFDNIRKEPFYAWVPWLGYERMGNAFHNPAVTFWSPSKDTKAALGIAENHRAFNTVKRGAVSHGCLRMPPGQVWEMRHIFPVQNSVATQVYFFDVYDVDGNGTLEVMGVEYFISYSKSVSNDREGGKLDVSDDKRLEFYSNLYGKNGVFTVENGKYMFQNPSVSLPSYLNFQQKRKNATRVQMQGSFPLYEQKYQQDKIQFYVPAKTDGLTGMSNTPVSKRIVRLMGRIRGCAPKADKEACGEAAFDKEAKQIWNEVY